MNKRTLLSALSMVAVLSSTVYALPLADYSGGVNPSSVTNLLNYYTDNKSDTGTYESVSVPYEFVDTDYQAEKTPTSWSRAATGESGTFVNTAGNEFETNTGEALEEGDQVTFEIDLQNVATGAIINDMYEIFSTDEWSLNSITFNGTTLNAGDAALTAISTTTGTTTEINMQDVDPTLTNPILVVMTAAQNNQADTTFDNIVADEDKTTLDTATVDMKVFDYDFAKTVSIISRGGSIIWDATTGGPFPNTNDGDVITYELAVAGQNGGTTPATGITLYDIFETEGFVTPPTFSNDGSGTSAYATEDIDADTEAEGVITWSNAEDGDTLTVSLTVGVQ